MKALLQLSILILMFVVTDVAFAQPGPPMGRGGMKGAEKLERFKKMRLIEVLKLNEEESIRFFARQSAHEDRARDLMRSRNDIIDRIESIVREGEETKDLPKLLDQILDVDQKIFAERQRYQMEQQKALTAEQFAKFMVFERNFGRQVRDAMGEMYREHRRPPNDESDE